MTPGPTGSRGGGTFTEEAGTNSQSVGLVSLVPAADRLRVDWRAEEVEDLDAEVLLYLSTSETELFESVPIVVALEDKSFVFNGLLGNTEYFVGMALDLNDGSALEPAVGSVLAGTTFAPIYADPFADPNVADGLSPETAFPNLFVAMLSAFLNGAGSGGNVWVAEGTFSGVSLGVLEGVHIYGGFAQGFDLEQRDPALHPTVLLGLEGASILTMAAAAASQTLDGLELDGLGTSSSGVDVDRTAVDLRGLTVRGCARGVRIRSPHFASSTDVRLIHCLLVDNLTEGLSLDGVYSVDIEACTFQTNGQEGLEFGPWIAPSGETVSLQVRDSRFSGNGFEGLDIDLSTATDASGVGGVFDVRIEGSLFEQNGTSGLLIDLDFETQPSWFASVVVRGCQSRANADHGVALDLDAPASCLLHRLLSTANGQDGLSLTSESLPGMLLVSSSAFVANLGAGVRTSLGNVGVALSHCALAGNAQSGVDAHLSGATVASSVSHLQTAAFNGVRLVGSLELGSESAPFMRAPVEYRSVVGLSGEMLQLDAALNSALDGACELVSDGVVRSVASTSGSLLGLDSLPEFLPIPTVLTVFESSDSVNEDYRPSPTSQLFGAGMTLPSGETPDAGPFGALLGGAPGTEELVPPELFRVTASEPAWGQAIAATASLRVRFAGGTPDEPSLQAGLCLVDFMGNELTLDARLEGTELVVSAPPGGWAVGDVLKLHSTLLSRVSADPLIAMALPIGVL